MTPLTPEQEAYVSRLRSANLDYSGEYADHVAAELATGGCPLNYFAFAFSLEEERAIKSLVSTPIHAF